MRADELKAKHALEMKQAENDILLKRLTLEAEMKAADLAKQQEVEIEKQRIAADL